MDRFSEIAPYEGQDFEDAIERLKQYPQLLDNFTDIISRKSRIANTLLSVSAKKNLRERLNEVHSYDDFQKKITSEIFLEMIEHSSMSSFSFDGINQLGEDKPHVYISNHRDIILDTAMLDHALYKSDRMLCEMVIGTNLLVNQFTEDLFRVNGAIKINRSLSSAKDLMQETNRLSQYVTNTIENKKKSVWIAQKSGRSKDGNDNTSPAILKMLYLFSRSEGLSFSDFLKRVSIVPVSVSYQYDPCDVTKSHAEIRKLKQEGCYDVYKKKKYEDVLDMVRGLRLNKGNVHIQVGTELSSDLPDLKSAVREIDRQIHLNYRLFDTNYYCYDKLCGTRDFEEFYQSFDGKKFDKHYKNFSPLVVDHVYNSYANPVRSMLYEKSL